MAEAVQELWPGTRVTIGPVIENEFYYDFDKPDPFHPEDLEKIEARMREIINATHHSRKKIWSRDQAKQFFREQGEHYKVELVDAIPAGEDIRIYRQGKWLDLCRGPHMTATGQVGDAFKLMRIAGAYWRGNSNNPMLQRIYGTAWASQGDLKAHLDHLAEMERRDHRQLGREIDLFHFAGRGARRGVLAPEGLDAVPDPGRLHAPATGRGRVHRGQFPRHHGEVALGAFRPLGEVRRADVLDADAG